MTKPPTTRLSILFILVVLCGVGFYYVENKIKTTNNLLSEIDYISNSHTQLEDLKLSIPTLTEDINNWKNTLPSTEDEVAIFATRVEQIAKGQGIITAIDFDDFPGPITVLGHEVNGLGADITLDGSYRGLTNFMSEISTLPYFYKVDKLTITKHETKLGVKTTINGVLITNFGEK